MAGTAYARVLLVASVAALVAGCQGEGSPFGKKAGPSSQGPASEGPAIVDPNAKPGVIAGDAVTTETLDGAAAATTDAAKPGKPEKPAKQTKAKSVKLVDRDIEAPEVFSVTDMALWDGRPSLGGVWVASPDAVDPERVILRNAANGKFVIGALFRRERDNPGPSLQISSDAATALGLLAGQPGKISVTALRREEAPVTAPDASKPILDAAETVETEALTANADAAISAAEGGAAPEPAQKKAKGGFGLFKKKQKASDGPVAPVVSSEPAAPAATAPTAPAAKPVAPAPAPKASAGGVIQIGIFSVEANAKRAADTLGKAGVPATVHEEKSQGKTFWSVTASGGAEALAKAKAAGFADAYVLKRG